MSITPNILILSTDDKLSEEANMVFASLAEDAPRFRVVGTTNALFESIRNQPVSLVLIEYGEDPKDLLDCASQIQSVSPDTNVAAILRPEGFAENLNESA